MEDKIIMLSLPELARRENKKLKEFLLAYTKVNEKGEPTIVRTDVVKRVRRGFMIDRLGTKGFAKKTTLKKLVKRSYDIMNKQEFDMVYVVAKESEWN